MVALAGMNLVSGAVALALLPSVRVPPGPVLAVVALSVALHVGYKLALASLYSGTHLSRVYPLARGMTPIVAMVLGFAVLGDRPSNVALVGIVAVSAGILGLVVERSAVHLSPAQLGAAFAAGSAVACYSVVDAYGIRLSGDWLGFTAWLVACDSGAFVLYVIALRRRAALQTWRTQWGRTLISGLLGTISFGIFAWALGRAQVGMVVALRETSIVFAALIGAMVLREAVTLARWLSALLVMAGVAAVSFFG